MPSKDNINNFKRGGVGILTCKDIMKALKKLGWYEVKVSRGTDHKKYAHVSGKTTIVPYKGNRQLAVGTINAICKQTGLDKKTLSKYS